MSRLISLYESAYDDFKRNIQRDRKILNEYWEKKELDVKSRRNANTGIFATSGALVGTALQDLDVKPLSVKPILAGAALGGLVGLGVSRSLAKKASAGNSKFKSSNEDGLNRMDADLDRVHSKFVDDFGREPNGRELARELNKLGWDFDE